jgi:hypothetical protein
MATGPGREAERAGHADANCHRGNGTGKLGVPQAGAAPHHGVPAPAAREDNDGA